MYCWDTSLGITLPKGEGGETGSHLQLDKRASCGSEIGTSSLSYLVTCLTSLVREWAVSNTAEQAPTWIVFVILGRLFSRLGRGKVVKKRLEKLLDEGRLSVARSKPHVETCGDSWAGCHCAALCHELRTLTPLLSCIEGPKWGLALRSAKHLAAFTWKNWSCT